MHRACILTENSLIKRILSFINKSVFCHSLGEGCYQGGNQQGSGCGSLYDGNCCSTSASNADGSGATGLWQIGASSFENPAYAVAGCPASEITNPCCQALVVQKILIQVRYMYVSYGVVWCGVHKCMN